MQTLREQQRQKDRILQQQRYEDAKRRALQEYNPDEREHKMRVEHDNLVNMIPRDVRGDSFVKDLVKRRLASFAEKENNRHNDFNTQLKLDQRNKEQGEEIFDEIEILLGTVYDKLKSGVNTNLFEDLAKLKRIVYAKLYFLNDKQLIKLFNDFMKSTTYSPASGYARDVLTELQSLLIKYEEKSKHKTPSQRKHILEELKHSNLKNKFIEKTRTLATLPRGRTVDSRPRAAHAVGTSLDRTVHFVSPESKAKTVAELRKAFETATKTVEPSTDAFKTAKPLPHETGVVKAKKGEVVGEAPPARRTLDFESDVLHRPRQPSRRSSMSPTLRVKESPAVAPPPAKKTREATSPPLPSHTVTVLAAPAPAEPYATAIAHTPPKPPAEPIAPPETPMGPKAATPKKPLSFKDAILSPAKDPPAPVAVEDVQTMANYKGKSYAIPSSLNSKWSGATLKKWYGHIPITESDTSTKHLSFYTDVPLAKARIRELFYPDQSS